MCGSMVDIQSATDEIRQKKKIETTGQKYNVRICYTQAAIKNRHAQKKRSSHKVRRVSPEARRESMLKRLVKEVGLGRE